MTETAEHKRKNIKVNCQVRFFQEGGVKQFKIQIQVIRYTAYLLKCVLTLTCSLSQPY